MLRRKVQSIMIFVELGRIGLKGTEYRNSSPLYISVLCTFGNVFNANATNIMVLCTFA